MCSLFPLLARQGMGTALSLPGLFVVLKLKLERNFGYGRQIYSTVIEQYQNGMKKIVGNLTLSLENKVFSNPAARF